VLQSPVQGGDLFTGLGDLVLEQAETLSLADLPRRGLGEPDAGQVRFGTRLIERAAQLLQPTLEQYRPVGAGGGASSGGRYAFSQRRTMGYHYSKTRQSAKPVRQTRRVPRRKGVA